MKIGLLTWHSVINHGAILQAYALKSVLENKGHQVYLLDYIRNCEKVVKQNSSGKLNFDRYNLRRIYGRIFLNKKKEKFKLFKEKHFSTVVDDNLLDIICIGSDEVFDMSSGYTKEMFGEGLKKHFAYAPCFGRTTLEKINAEEDRERIGKCLKNFSALSSRDFNTQKIIKECSGIETRIVLDPTILYGFDKERCKTKTVDKISKLKKYLVLYSYQENYNKLEERKAIKDFAKKYNMPIISLGYFHPWCNMSINADPFEFIEIMRNASYVVTDTFHGTAFSILFNKQFCTSYKWYNKEKMSSLLSIFDLESQLISDVNQINNALENCLNYKSVNEKIEEYRILSNKYIDNALTN